MPLDLHKHSEMGKLPTAIVDENWTLIEGAYNGLEQTFQAQLPPSNLTATRDPSVDDDYTEGWRAWSKWINVNDGTSWVLLDPEVGAALWWKTPFDPSGFGSAAMADLGTAPDNVPQNSDLGSAAYRAVGTAPADVVDISIGDARYMSAGETLVTLGAGDAVEFDAATLPEFISGAPQRVLSAEIVQSAHGRVALTDGPTIAVDLSAGINFEVTLDAGESRELSNPSNGTPGAYYSVLVKGGGASASTLTLGNQFGGEMPVGMGNISSTQWRLLTIVCISATHYAATAMDVSPP